MKSIEQRVSNPKARRRAIGATLAFALVLLSFFATPTGHAQNFSVLHTFTAYPDGEFGVGLLSDASGKLYGTTQYGGSTGGGTLFKLDSGGQYKVYSVPFAKPFYGYSPNSHLIDDASGNLYGTTWGGSDAYEGTVFKVDKAGVFTYLHGFTGQDGSRPYAPLARDQAGNLYGTTGTGGDLSCADTAGCGVVFKVDAAGNFSVLHTFEQIDGNFPFAGLVLDAAGNLYGTTVGGGAHDLGTIFKLDTTGVLTLLHEFFDNAHGTAPYGTLTRDSAGNLYGTTVGGGPSLYGTIFKLSATGKYRVLYSFTGGTDGGFPWVGVIRDRAGNLYGTTEQGGDLACSNNGSSGCGVVFKLDMTGALTVLHTFENTDGAVPGAGVVLDKAGNLYGTTFYGGDLTCNGGIGCGVVFSITP